MAVCGVQSHYVDSTNTDCSRLLRMRDRTVRLFSHALQTLNLVIVVVDLRPRTRLQQLEWGRLWKSRRRIGVGFRQTLSRNVFIEFITAPLSFRLNPLFSYFYPKLDFI